MERVSTHLIEDSKMPSNNCTALDNHDIKAHDIEVDMARSLVSLDVNARPKAFANFFEEIVFVFTVMMATASTTFLQGVIIINTETIGKDLVMNPAQVTWIASAVGLTNGSFVLFFGKTADLFGRKIQLILGTTLLGLFSLITSFVPSPTSMLVLCGLLGIGTAMIGPPAIGILLATYPEGQRRNKVTGVLGAGNPVGFIMGSISSGLATKYSSWRSSFLVIAIFFLAMTTLVVWTVPSIPRSGSRCRMVQQFDYLGTAFMVIGMALISAALTESPTLGWYSFKIILMLSIGIFCVVSFIVWETIFPFPLLNPVVWSDKNFALILLSASFGYMSFITNEFWIALYMQEIQNFAPLHIAVLLLPQALAGVIWSYLGQSLVSKISGTLIMATGGLAYLAGAILLIFIKRHTSYWMFLFPALCITVIGADFQFIVSNLYVTKQMPEQSSLASGVLQSGRSLSIFIGLAITFAVYGSMAEMPRGKLDPTLPYYRVYICTILFAVMSLLFIPFMKIEKQGNNPALLSISSNSSSTTAVSEHTTPALTDGVDDNANRSKENHVLAKEPGDSSHSSAATAGSFDTFFPRWSWEQLGRWPDDRHRFSDENVVYEVCIKCLQERKVLAQEGRTSRHEIMDEDLDASWDIESQHRQPPINVRTAVSGHDLVHENQTRSGETTPSSIKHIQNISTSPYRQSTQDREPTSLETPLKTGYQSQLLSSTAVQLVTGSNRPRQVEQEVRYDSPMTGERVLLKGHSGQNASMHQLISSSPRDSSSPYRRILTCRLPEPMPALPLPSPSSIQSRNSLMLPHNTKIQACRLSTHASRNQRHMSSYREDTTFISSLDITDGPASVNKNAPRQASNRPIAILDQTPIQSLEGFTSIELNWDGDQRYRESVASRSTRGANRREMASQYSALTNFKRERTAANSRVIVNPGGYEQRIIRGGCEWI